MEKLQKPVAHVTPRKLASSTTGSSSGTVTGTPGAFKVPKTPGNKPGDLAQELNALGVAKAKHDPRSRSVEPKSKKPLVTNLMLDRMVKTPASRRELKFASGAKFDPKFVTGIPLIKPKKPTVVKPFKFASEERALLKKTKLDTVSALK